MLLLLVYRDKLGRGSADTAAWWCCLALMHIPCFMLCQGGGLMEQSILQVLREVLGVVVDQAVAKG